MSNISRKIWAGMLLFGSLALAVDPVPYPLGTPCTNEWGYVGWDTTDDTDVARLTQIHNALCDDVLSMAIDAFLVSYNSGDSENVIYPRFFPKSDDDDDYEAQVTDTFAKIYNEGSGTGEFEATVAGMNVDKADFLGYCANGDAAYTGFDDTDGHEKIHFCDSFYTEPDINSLTCDGVGPAVDENMNSFQRIMFHEMFHYSTVGPASQLGEQITDTTNADGIKAYGPERAHGLLAQDDNPFAATINADNYAWMGTNAFFMSLCDNTWYDDPAAYVPGSPPPEDDE